MWCRTNSRKGAHVSHGIAPKSRNRTFIYVFKYAFYVVQDWEYQEDAVFFSNIATHKVATLCICPEDTIFL